jgi:xanthine dehydrogenase FAD-binding subunit
MAASVRIEEGRVVEVRVALGGVAPVPLRCPGVERALVEGDRKAARSALQGALVPIDDVRSTARYRRRVAENLLEELVQRLGDVELDG